MTGFIINNKEYNVGLGSGSIEYVGSADHIGYSEYGANIPSIDTYGWLDWNKSSYSNDKIIGLGYGSANGTTLTNGYAQQFYDKSSYTGQDVFQVSSRGYSAVIEIIFPQKMKFQSIEIRMSGNGNTVNMHISTSDGENSWVEQAIDTNAYYSEVYKTYNLNNAEGDRFKLWFSNPSSYGTKSVYRLVDINAKKWGKKS